MPGWDEDGGEGVIERKLVFCPNLQDLDTDELIKTCPECDDYFVFCCSCSQKYYDTGKPCHHFRLVFTDGACCNNGQLDATAGIGVAYSLGESAQYALPIEADDDPGQKRTSQRAELLAALAGLRIMAEADRLNEDPEKAESGPKRRRRHGPRDAENAWVIATDSEYVAKGITEWFPVWKKNSVRNSRGARPSNLDLFVKLDAALTAEESRKDLKIGFWHVPREYNTLADSLAKRAAKLGDPA